MRNVFAVTLVCGAQIRLQFQCQRISTWMILDPIYIPPLRPL
jgi:hypothetical protein